MFSCGTPTHTNALNWAKQYGKEMTWGEYYSVDSDLMVATVRPTALTGVYSLKHDASSVNSGAHAYVDFATGEIGFYKVVASGEPTAKLATQNFTFEADKTYEIQHTVIGGHELTMTVTDTQTKTSATVQYLGDNNAAYYSRSLGTHTDSCTDDSVQVISKKLYSLQPYNTQALIMGDSFVAGFYRTRYATLIKNDIGGSAFINGVSGGDTDHVQEMLKYLPDLCNPKYVVLAIGTNQNGFTRWSTDMQDILNTIETAWPEAEIILGTITLRTDKTEQNLPFVTQANEWIRNSGYKYVDIYQLTTNVNGDTHTQITNKFQSDGVHLTPAANEEVYNKFKAEVPELFQ